MQAETEAAKRAFFAQGGTIETVPGFDGIKPLPSTPEIKRKRKPKRKATPAPIPKGARPVLTLSNLVRLAPNQYVLHGGKAATRREAMRYLQRANAPRVQTQLLPCGATVERRCTPWKTRTLSI